MLQLRYQLRRILHYRAHDLRLAQLVSEPAQVLKHRDVAVRVFNGTQESVDELSQYLACFFAAVEGIPVLIQ